jgi:hypothetical protein
VLVPPLKTASQKSAPPPDTAEANCANPFRVYNQCLQWAEQHRARFAPNKYHLIHLSRRQQRSNIRASIALRDVTVEPVDLIRILSVPGHKVVIEKTPDQNSRKDDHPHKYTNTTNRRYMGLPTNLSKTGIQHNYITCNYLWSISKVLTNNI